MKIAPTSVRSHYISKLEEVLVTSETVQSKLSVAPLPVSRDARYSNAYECAQKRARSIADRLQSSFTHPSVCANGENSKRFWKLIDRQVDAAVESAGMLERMFYYVCMSDGAQDSVIELTPSEIELFGYLSDMSNLAMFVNEQAGPEEPSPFMKDIFEEVGAGYDAMYGSYVSDMGGVEQVDTPLSYAAMRSQVGLFIERDAYEQLNALGLKWRGFMRSLPGTAVILNPTGSV